MKFFLCVSKWSCKYKSNIAIVETQPCFIKLQLVSTKILINSDNSKPFFVFSCRMSPHLVQVRLVVCMGIKGRCCLEHNFFKVVVANYLFIFKVVIYYMS